jgi:hypothetical protein
MTWQGGSAQRMAAAEFDSPARRLGRAAGPLVFGEVRRVHADLVPLIARKAEVRQRGIWISPVTFVPPQSANPEQTRNYAPA